MSQIIDYEYLNVYIKFDTSLHSEYEAEVLYNVVAVKVSKRNKSKIPFQVPSKLNIIHVKLIMNHKL